MPKNIAQYFLRIKMDGLAIKLTIIDNAVEINGAAQRSFLLTQEIIITGKTGITSNTDIFHQFIVSLHIFFNPLLTFCCCCFFVPTNVLNYIFICIYV